MGRQYQTRQKPKLFHNNGEFHHNSSPKSIFTLKIYNTKILLFWCYEETSKT